MFTNQVFLDADIFAVTLFCVIKCYLFNDMKLNTGNASINL